MGIRVTNHEVREGHEMEFDQLSNPNQAFCPLTLTS